MKADYPDIRVATIDIPQQQLDQYQQAMVEHSLGKRIVYEGVDYSRGRFCIREEWQILRRRYCACQDRRAAIPKSRTVSPGFSSASAVGLPHPSEARTAASGNWLFSPTSYRFEVIGSVEQHDDGADPQQAPPLPETTRRAA